MKKIFLHVAKRTGSHSTSASSLCFIYIAYDVSTRTSKSSSLSERRDKSETRIFNEFFSKSGCSHFIHKDYVRKTGYSISWANFKICKG